MRKVWPSGAARITSLAATLPLAPGLLSTTTGWPRASLSDWAITRATLILKIKTFERRERLPGKGRRGLDDPAGRSTDTDGSGGLQVMQQAVMIDVRMGDDDGSKIVGQLRQQRTIIRTPVERQAEVEENPNPLVLQLDAAAADLLRTPVNADSHAAP